jgi:hypothetical protein
VVAQQPGFPAPAYRAGLIIRRSITMLNGFIMI